MSKKISQDATKVSSRSSKPVTKGPPKARSIREASVEGRKAKKEEVLAHSSQEKKVVSKAGSKTQGKVDVSGNKLSSRSRIGSDDKKPLKARTSSRITEEKQNEVRRKLATNNSKTSVKSELRPKEKIRSRVSESSGIKVRKPATHAENVTKSTPRITPRPVNKSRPVTPPSSRVTKTQFFPSKKMYSNALSDASVSPRVSEVLHSTEPPKKRTITPTVEEEPSSCSNSVSERPKTATLRKGVSVVSITNMVGPDIPKKKTIKSSSSSKPQIPKPDSPDYEDDFESYESDFEEYTSSDSATNLNISEISNDSSSSSSSEPSGSQNSDGKLPQKRSNSAGTDDEKKMDSGNYELPENKHRHILDNIKESIEKENANIGHSRSNMASLSDEGFEEGKSMQFINFLDAQKKNQRRKSMEKRKKRGDEIMSMIRLDCYSFTLFDLPPVPYETFIRHYGRSNTLQTSVQTGEDNISEETQTEEADRSNKWTQSPPNLSSLPKVDEEDFWDIYRCHYLGVGGEDVKKQRDLRKYNDNYLEEFLLSAGRLIINLQGEADTVINYDQQTSSSNIPFSKGYILCETEKQDILKGRPFVNACFNTLNPNKILTIHGSREENEENSNKSIVCLWNIMNINEPEVILGAFGDILCSSTIVLWDTKERISYHRNVRNEASKEALLVRMPTYLTEISQSHLCKVVSIYSLSNVAESSESNIFEINKSSQISSLDEEGDIIIWSVISKHHNRVKTEDQGLAYWGKVILVQSSRIRLQEQYPEIVDFKCTDLAINHLDPNHLYISTTNGIIMHQLANGGRVKARKFTTEKDCQIRCLQVCPFTHKIILAGCDNGDINFYSDITERPLITMSDKSNTIGQNGVEAIQWSFCRPLVFYTKDGTNTINVWNLKSSDFYPEYSVQLEEEIACIRMSPLSRIQSSSEDMFMMIATTTGKVYLHLLGGDHGLQTLDDYEQDKTKFLNYLNLYL